MGCMGWGGRRARNWRGRVMRRVRKGVHIFGRRECEMDGMCYQRGIVGEWKVKGNEEDIQWRQSKAM